MAIYDEKELFSTTIALPKSYMFLSDIFFMFHTLLCGKSSHFMWNMFLFLGRKQKNQGDIYSQKNLPRGLGLAPGESECRQGGNFSDGRREGIPAQKMTLDSG